VVDLDEQPSADRQIGPLDGERAELHPFSSSQERGSVRYPARPPDPASIIRSPGVISYPMPALDEAELADAEAGLAEYEVRLLSGTIVDPAGVIRAKHVPAARVRAFHIAGVGRRRNWPDEG
jgi:hypothetical protein